jgi:hypothetical protein
MKMAKRASMSQSPWSVPIALHEVPETGRSVELVADERARAAIARLAGLRSLPRLHAAFEVTLHGRDALRVRGRVSATVGQTCVVTLEPIENEIDEAIDLLFAPVAASSLVDHASMEVEIAAEDGPEPLIGGVVDLGALATEFLVLGIDPYPRKPGAVFEGSSLGDGSGNPFAALAALKKGQGGKQG